jgi:chromosomal replication initiation ATPase DnaA
VLDPALARPQPPRQLVLDLALPPALGADDFVTGAANAAARTVIDTPEAWPDQRLALVGPAGAGKSHLASILEAATGATRITAAALADAAVPALAGHGVPVIVEDLDRAAALDQPALFHLLNLARETRTPVLITARLHPSTLPVTLPDLASRLRAFPVVEILPPDEALLGALLLKLFADRGLLVDPAVIGYLVLRMERSYAAARALVARLDTEAASRKREVTKNLAASVLGDPDEA